MTVSLEFFALTLTFGLISGQNSLNFDDNKGQNDFDYVYDYGSGDLMKDNFGSKKIGDLEFDVEVAEQMPKLGESIPEINVENKDYYDGSSDDSLGWSEELPVELMTDSEQIGNIMVDVEVADKDDVNSFDSTDDTNETNETTEERQAFPADISANKRGPVKVPKYFQSDPNSTSDDSTTSPLETTTSGSSDVQSSSESSDAIDSSTDFTQPPGGLPPPPGGPQNHVDTKPGPNQEQDRSTTKTPPTSEVWPMILVAILIVFFAICGIVWAIFRLCMVKKAEDDLEKQVAAATAAGFVADDSTTANTSGEPMSQVKSLEEVDRVRSDFDSNSNSRPSPSKPPPSGQTSPQRTDPKDQTKKKSVESIGEEKEKSEESLKQIKLKAPSDEELEAKKSPENRIETKKSNEGIGSQGSDQNGQNTGSIIGSQQLSESL